MKRSAPIHLILVLIIVLISAYVWTTLSAYQSRYVASISSTLALSESLIAENISLLEYSDFDNPLLFKTLKSNHLYLEQLIKDMETHHPKKILKLDESIPKTGGETFTRRSFELHERLIYLLKNKPEGAQDTNYVTLKKYYVKLLGDIQSVRAQKNKVSARQWLEQVAEFLMSGRGLGSD